MASVVTSHRAGLVRGARPEAILIVLFLLIALFVFLGGGKKKGKGKSSERREEGDEARDRKGRSRRSDPDIDSESGRSNTDRKTRKERSSDRGRTPDSSSDEERDKKEREGAERRKKRKDEEERDKKKDSQEQAARSQAQVQDDAVPRLDAPSLLDEIIDPLSDKLWQRDPTKRPERPSGRSPPILLKRDENNQWTRPPLSGKKGVSFDDGGMQGKELSSVAAYNHEDPSNRIYDQSHTDIKRNHISTERGRDGDVLQGMIDGSQSPLIDLIKSGKLSEKLVGMMKRLEWACLIDHLDLLNQIPQNVLKESNDIINKETFIPKIGPVPNSIIDIIQQMLIEKAVDLPLVLSSQSNPNMEHVNPNIPYDDDPDISPLDKKTVQDNFINKHLYQFGVAAEDIRDNLGYGHWKDLGVDAIREVVYKWTERKMKEASQPQSGTKGEEQYDIFRLLLGYFLPYHRAITSFRPKHFKERDKVPGFVEKVGPVNAGLVQWLRYIGKCLLISRIFSENGSELSLDLSLKVQVSKRSRQVGLIVDYTLFIPKPTTSDQDEGQKRLIGMIYQSREILERVKHTLILWVNHLNEKVYPPRESGNYLFNDLYPFQINRLTFRPGLPLQTINFQSLQRSLTSPSPPDTSDGREKMIINVSSSHIEEMFEKTKQRGEGPSFFGELYRTITCQMIRFINKRQYHWYKPSTDAEGRGGVYEKFDEKQFEFLLMLIGPGLSKVQLTEEYKSKTTGEKMKDKESMLEYNYGDTVKYSQLQAIDFGGLIPIEEPPPGYASLREKKIVKMDLFKGLKWILLPVQFNTGDSQEGGGVGIYSANLVVNDNLGLTNYLYGNSQNSLSVTFHGRSLEDKNRLSVELAQTIVEQINRWIKDISENTNMMDEQQIRRRVMEKVDMTKRMIRNKVKFVIISSDSQQQQQQAEIEKFDDTNNLNDFDIPQEMLPPVLVV
ncbi:hypothetical protein L486_07283 [Kwoniella mangroviensis CBS 10435]|uniref:Uncharacterized protein n=1 Tax=Kwoniella mangroviensis CBS 10435 TaxID=1331196 RepID=A0A1B9IIF0_9TREE|nr:hypothetical protein L486_07283 [Kwoniella mangroviensis CBS 10435]